MEISNFSSLIEVGATLNIACVAVEYVKSYTSVLCNQVFNLADQIDKAVKQCQQKLNEVMDETTLSALPDNMSGGRSILTLKRSLTKSRSTIETEIKSEETKLKNAISTVCEVKNVSSICLWLFFYGVTALFLMGIESSQADKNVNIHLLWTIVTILGFIFSIIGWITCGERRPWWKFGYCSLRFSIISFGITLLLGSCVFFIPINFLTDLSESLWGVTIILSMILMYSNFVASSFAVWHKAKNGKLAIENSLSALLFKCEQWNQEAADLQGALHVDEKLADERDDSLD